MFNDFFPFFLLLVLIEDDINTDLGEAKLLSPTKLFKLLFCEGKSKVSRENSILMCKMFQRYLASGAVVAKSPSQNVI